MSHKLAIASLVHCRLTQTADTRMTALRTRPAACLTSPKNPNPSKPFKPWWSSDAEDRAIDMYWNWEFYREAEDRSLDRMIEAHRSDRAVAKRAKASKKR